MKKILVKSKNGSKEKLVQKKRKYQIRFKTENQIAKVKKTKTNGKNHLNLFKNHTSKVILKKIMKKLIEVHLLQLLRKNQKKSQNIKEIKIQKSKNRKGIRHNQMKSYKNK